MFSKMTFLALSVALSTSAFANEAKSPERKIASQDEIMCESMLKLLSSPAEDLQKRMNVVCDTSKPFSVTQAQAYGLLGMSNGQAVMLFCCVKK